jgi:hypothetical protein
MQRIDQPKFIVARVPEGPRVPDVPNPRYHNFDQAYERLVDCMHSVLARDQRRLLWQIAWEPNTRGEKANQFFLQRVRQLSGVLRAEPQGGEASEYLSVKIYLRKGDLNTEYSVYQLKGQTYDRFPEARLDVWVLHEEAPTEESSDAAAPG